MRPPRRLARRHRRRPPIWALGPAHSACGCLGCLRPFWAAI